MVQNNKVLTVSYGTFSCTLEGFDDSFETMKSIAEYFRDLAADDRYFGSEPPQPDAEMLTRIAQRDIARRVEASQSESGLLLRATDEATTQPAAEVPSPTPQPTPQPAPVQAEPAPVAHTPPAPSTPDLTVVEQSTPQTAAAFFDQAQTVETPPAATAPASDSIAAKLQRIRAVVSHSNENRGQFSDEEDSGDLTAAEAPVDAITAAFEAGSLNPADIEEEAVEVVSAEPLVLEDEVKSESDERSEAEEDTAEDIILSEETEEETLEVSEDEIEIEETEIEVEKETLEAPEEDTEALDEAEEASEEPVESTLYPAYDEETEEEAEEVSNILFEEDEQAEEEVAQEETAASLMADSDDDHEVFEAGILTADDEQNILNEIADVEAEFAAKAEKAEKVEAVDVGFDNDVSRLMDKADEQMEDPSTSDKRETYSQLRAAVAVTEAERKGKDESDEMEGGTYRTDLASVVSPRRPEIQVTSLRPESDRAAPLKLVAEQRVDSDDADKGPIMPRRVSSTSDDNAEAQDSGFALFAQEQGAQSLPDLLEAAASYLSFIEGQEQFSRPQLMNKVRALKQDDFNREESLRSFGQLLRDGKIEKAGGGRFAASNHIGFRPDDEREAG